MNLEKNRTIEKDRSNLIPSLTNRTNFLKSRFNQVDPLEYRCFQRIGKIAPRLDVAPTITPLSISLSLSPVQLPSYWIPVKLQVAE